MALLIWCRSKVWLIRKKERFARQYTGNWLPRFIKNNKGCLQKDRKSTGTYVGNRQLLCWWWQTTWRILDTLEGNIGKVGSFVSSYVMYIVYYTPSILLCTFWEEESKPITAGGLQGLQSTVERFLFELRRDLESQYTLIVWSFKDKSLGTEKVNNTAQSTVKNYEMFMFCHNVLINWLKLVSIRWWNVTTDESFYHSMGRNDSYKQKCCIFAVLRS